MNETDSTLPPLLARITHPSMVADLSLADKQILATELRQTIIRTVAANGGHLAPSLGVVELTLALLSVFDPEEDKLVWDVGHQSYAWTPPSALFLSVRIRISPWLSPVFPAHYLLPHAIEAGDLLDSVKSILFVSATCREWNQLMFDISIIIDVVILGQKVFGPYDTGIKSCLAPN